SGVTSTTARPSRSATRRCRRPSRRSSRPRSGTWTWPTATSARRPASISAIRRATPPTASTSARWPVPGFPADPAAAASAAPAGGGKPGAGQRAEVEAVGGLRDHGDVLAFAPRLPAQLTGLSFRLVYRARRLRIDISSDRARYELLAGEPLDLLHHGEPFTLVPASPQTHTCPTLPEPPAVEPPPGRGVRQHGVGAAARSARMTPRAAQR